jgi:hypothetical protein
MMGHVLKTFLGLAAVSAVALSFTAVAEAAHCKGRHCKGPRADEPGVYRYIYVESNTGPQRAFAPVRHGPMGDQVKLPEGGSWIDCEVTCEYTLRRQTVDFWEGQTQKYTSPNYLRYDVDLTERRVRRRYPQ